MPPENRRQYRAIGGRLATFVRQQPGGLPSVSALQAAVADLAAEHEELVLPLKFLVSRPAFPALAAKAGSGSGTVQRQALLQTMKTTFTPDLIEALEDILSGFLDLPVGSDPAAKWPNPDSYQPPPRPASSPKPQEDSSPTFPHSPAPALHQIAPASIAPDHPENPWVFWRGVLLTLGVALGVRQFIVEARYIPSGSMLPGLQLQDRLLVEKLSYRQRAPRRGEIVVFHAPQHFDPVLRVAQQAGPLQCLVSNLPLINALPGMQAPACDAYIKRVVAVAGDRVVVDPRGAVQVNGRRLNEPYVTNYCPVDPQGLGPCRTLNVVVPPKHVLVLGDNRSNSWDGRFWPGGPFLPESEIIGRAFWRFWPPATSGALRTPQP